MNTTSTGYSFSSFMQVSTVLVSTLAAALIALPLSITAGEKSGSLLQVTLFAVLGALIGYKRRKSRAFFYLSLVTVIIVSTIISFYSLKG